MEQEGIVRAKSAVSPELIGAIRKIRLSAAARPAMLPAQGRRS
jgi:hypothetical protein